jgi:hypothetical protein
MCLQSGSSSEAGSLLDVRRHSLGTARQSAPAAAELESPNWCTVKFCYIYDPQSRMVSTPSRQYSVTDPGDVDWLGRGTATSTTLVWLS